MLFNTFGINWKEENWLQFLPRYAERILRSSLWLFSKIIYNILFWLHHVITTVICHEILGVMVKSLNCQTYLDNSVLFLYSSFLWFRNLYYINANLQIYQYIYIYIYIITEHLSTQRLNFSFLSSWRNEVQIFLDWQKIIDLLQVSLFEEHFPLLLEIFTH